LPAGADLKVVQDMLGHSSIVLTADTYTSVLPEVAHRAAEDVATLIIQAGCLVPATTRPRQPEPSDRGGGGQETRSHARWDPLDHRCRCCRYAGARLSPAQP
jgi:hypothetical protein